MVRGGRSAHKGQPRPDEHEESLAALVKVLRVSGGNGVRPRPTPPAAHGSGGRLVVAAPDDGLDEDESRSPGQRGCLGTPESTKWHDEALDWLCRHSCKRLTSHGS
jgi:hypothetical protein